MLTATKRGAYREAAGVIALHPFDVNHIGTYPQRVLCVMKRSTLLDDIAEIKRHILEGEGHLLHHELERLGRGNSQTTKVAREILTSFEKVQSSHLNHRARLLIALREVTVP
jgi:hypothetical protein